MITSSCPRPASPSLAAAGLGETLMVSSCTRVPRWAWADAKLVENSSAIAKHAAKIAASRNRNWDCEVGTPPPLGSIGIIRLAGNREEIPVLQRVTSKIPAMKDLRPVFGALGL